jgi:hypothetical protein
MNLILKNFNEKNLLFLISFFLIFYIFINFTQRHFGTIQINDDKLIVKLTNAEIKKNVNQHLTSVSTYERILSKKCSVTGDMHDRHKVRWVKSLLLKNLYQLSEKLNSKIPYYINIILHCFLIFLSLIFLNQAFKLEKIHIIFFLLYISLIFQFHLGEYSYSIFEMFFVSVALYASKKKNITLFFLIILMAILNRESGFILILVWLIFNKEYKKLLIFSIIILTIFLMVNYESINCMINPKFFIPLEEQEGQTILRQLDSINILSRVLVITINYILPFGLIFYNVFKSNDKNEILILMGIIYLFVFLFASTIYKVEEKLIILPLIILSFNLSNKKIVN